MKKYTSVILGIMLGVGHIVQGENEGLWALQLALSGGKRIVPSLLGCYIDRYDYGLLPDADPEAVRQVQKIAEQVGWSDASNLKVKGNMFDPESPGQYLMPMGNASAYSNWIYVDDALIDLLSGKKDFVEINNPQGSVVLYSQDAKDFAEGPVGHELGHVFNRDCLKSCVVNTVIPVATWRFGRIIHDTISPQVKSSFGISPRSWSSTGVDIASMVILGAVQYVVNELILSGFDRSCERNADALAPNQRGLALYMRAYRLFESDASKKEHEGWFCSHPSPQEREELALKRAKELGQKDLDEALFVVKTANTESS